MDLSAGLYQQQTMKLSMTQELSQAISLLQMSNQDLDAFLGNKATENPLIAIDHVDGFSKKVKKGSHKSKADATYWIEQIKEEAEILSPYLLAQLPPSGLCERTKQLIKHLVYNLDSNGYLPFTMTEICARFGETEDLAERALSILQGMEPAGVGARNLQECLLLQIERKRTPKYTREIIEHHFMDFADKKWKALAKGLSIKMSDIQLVSDFIKTLDPRPCSRFAVEKSSFVVPDVMIECSSNSISVKLTADLKSKVKLDHSSFTSLKSDKQAGQYFQEKYKEYMWIKKGIEQREETLLRVTAKIAEIQPECMRKGLAYLKPMTMKEVAEQLDIHESTVSRTVKDKYVRAPFGTVEMKSFFSAALHSVGSNEEDVSAAAAKKAIHTMIEAEDKSKPLSDQLISDRLKAEQAIVLSRRTIAKYREQMGIQSSSKRKRY
ncbi:MAG: RNA polymerase factor sigma-54 [Bacillus sp. (in: firmicutes)]